MAEATSTLELKVTTRVALADILMSEPRAQNRLQGLIEGGNIFSLTDAVKIVIDRAHLELVTRPATETAPETEVMAPHEEHANGTGA